MKDDRKDYVIYKIVLIPENCVIYIGATSMQLKERLQYHLQNRCPVGKFLAKSGYDRSDVKIEAIEHVNGKSKAFQREHDITLEHIKNGIQLINDSIGTKLSNERRKKIGEETSSRPFRKWLDVEIKAKQCDKNKHYVFMLYKNSKPFFVGRTKNIYNSLYLLKKKFNCSMEEFDFEILATCSSVKEADVEKEKFILKYADSGIKNIQIGNHPSRKFIKTGAEAAKKLCSGVKNYNSIIVVDLKNGKLLSCQDLSISDFKKCENQESEDYVLAIDLSLDKLEKILSDDDFDFIQDYVKNKEKHLPKSRIDKLIESDKKHVECVELELVFENIEKAAFYIRATKIAIWKAVNSIMKYVKILKDNKQKLHWRYTDKQFNCDANEQIDENMLYKNKKAK